MVPQPLQAPVAQRKGRDSRALRPHNAFPGDDQAASLPGPMGLGIESQQLAVLVHEGALSVVQRRRKLDALDVCLPKLLEGLESLDAERLIRFIAGGNAAFPAAACSLPAAPAAATAT